MKTRNLPTVVWLAWTALILPIETTLAQGDLPQLELVAPADGEQFQPGNTITLRATVINDTGGPWQLEFFDGEEPIAQTRPNVPIWWKNASGGPHVITARATDPAGTTLISAPATILVGPGPTLPVVRVSARPWKTVEPCITCDVVPATLTFRRAGSTDEALVVHLETDGSATPGEDYPPLPTQVMFPVGQESVQMDLLPFDDQLAEGLEVVRVRLVSPPTNALSYLTSLSGGTAMIVIGEVELDGPEARLDIVSPQDGAHVPYGATVELSVIGVWTQGEVDQPVEFYDGDTFIGRSNPPISAAPAMPCLPRVHTVQWINPPPGEHVLTARYERISPEHWLISPPVHVTVNPETLRFKSITPVGNGLELIIHTERGQTYSLESSGNLIDWIPTPDLETIVSLEESIQLVVPRLPGVTKQFYRLVRPELSQAQTDQNFNRQKWLSKGIHTYEFEFNWSCECRPDFTQPVIISVVNDSIVSIVARDTGNSIERRKWDYWQTVDELFDWIQEAIDGGGVNLGRPEIITYDSELGYPTSGFIDYPSIADEEIGFDLELTSISLQPPNLLSLS